MMEARNITVVTGPDRTSDSFKNRSARRNAANFSRLMSAQGPP